MDNNFSLGFRWAIEIDGLDQFLAQTVQLPDDEVETFEVGAGVNDYNKTLPSKRKIGTMTIEKLIATDTTEVWAYDWLEKVATKKFSEYAKFAFVKQLAEDGQTVIRKYDVGEIFPKKVSGLKLDRKGNEVLMESVEFAVSRFKVSTS